ncbi:MAG: hypothetical protein GY830_04455 [Bacteroidetes bacterium]|nr:hypothetical protein [Bacteroidota bacterium]
MKINTIPKKLFLFTNLLLLFVFIVKCRTGNDNDEESNQDLKQSILLPFED